MEIGSAGSRSGQPRRWLITGGCGFIGTRLLASLLSDGHNKVRVIDNLSVGSREDLASVCAYDEVVVSDPSQALPEPEAGGCQLVVGDILDDRLAVGVAEGMDVIVHLAANTGVAPSVENPRKDCVTNVIGTLNYLEAARLKGVGRFVLASSGAPLGEQVPPLHEELCPHPVSPYGASKLAGEGYCSAYNRTFGIETVALRFGNVYGPGSARKESVVAKFIKRAMRGESLEVYGDGGQTRDFIYIDDLVEAIRLAACRDGVGGEVFQIATNRETTINELLVAMHAAFEDSGLHDTPVLYTENRLGDVRRNFSDTSKARQRLGWECRYDLQRGLAQTLQWFVDRG